MRAMTNPYAAVWAIDERDFPHDDTPAQRLRFALRYAILAPSGHNGQPWRFQIDGGLLQVYADRSRALPTIDPHDRELLISCYAAVHLVRVALEHFGYQPEVELLPESGDPDLLATVRLGQRLAPPVRRDLFDAVVARHSNRHPYLTRPIPGEQLTRLAAAAATEAAWLEPVTDRTTIAAMADLIAEGDRIKWREDVFRHELAERILPNRGQRRDGMPGYAFGLPGPLARLAPLVVRHLDLGRLRARSDRSLALAAPVLAIIGTDRDDPTAWMAAGQAMSHVLLRATADGLATSFLSQPIEVPELRPRLQDLLGRRGYPQLLLRIGYPRRQARPAPRRPLSDVLTSADASPGSTRGAALVDHGGRDSSNGTRR
jgi:nitroreductase